MPLQFGGSCHYHPMRPGIGVCVECRQVICSECTTQFEGINRCAACLSRMSKGAGTGAKKRSDWRLPNLLAFLLVFGLLFGGAALLASLLAP